MVGKPRLVLAANARPRYLGQGLALQHMIEAYEPISELTVLDQRTVPGSRVGQAIGRVPIVRRRVDWMTLASDTSFDRHVARMLPEGDAFQGVAGQCARSIDVAKARGMRTILDVLNSHVDDYQAHVTRESAKFGLRSFIHPRMVERTRREYAQADVMRVMSHVAARTFYERGFPASRVVVATPHLDMSEFPIARFDDPTFRVIFVGLVAPWKGFHLLIEAWERLRLANAELVIWGGPGARSITNYLRDARARMPNIVVRPTSVRTAGLGEVYGKASVLVHPSLADGFAYVVTEAMASGLPVITTTNTGASDVVEDGESGFVIPAGDVRAIEERLDHLYRHRELLPEIGKRARAAATTLTVERFRASMATCLFGESGAPPAQRATA